MALTRNDNWKCARRIGNSGSRLLLDSRGGSDRRDLRRPTASLLEGAKPPEISSLSIDLGPSSRSRSRVVAKRTGKWFCAPATASHRTRTVCDRDTRPSRLPIAIASACNLKAPGLGEIRQAEYAGLEDRSTTWRAKAQWGRMAPTRLTGVPGPVHVVHGCDRALALGSRGFFDRDGSRADGPLLCGSVRASLYELAARFMVDHVACGPPASPDALEQVRGFLDRSWASNNKDLWFKLTTRLLPSRWSSPTSGGHRPAGDRWVPQKSSKAVIGDAAGVDLRVLGKIRWARTGTGPTFSFANAGGGALAARRHGPPGGHEEARYQLSRPCASSTRPIPGYRPFRAYWAKGWELVAGAPKACRLEYRSGEHQRGRSRHMSDRTAVTSLARS